METEVAKQQRKKPRIRKSAPTVREIATKQGQPESSSQKRSVIFRVITWPFRWLAGSSNPVARGIRAILRPIGRVLSKLVPRYFINSWRELKLVTWPGRIETWRLTAAVFVFAIVFGVVIYFVDMGLERLFRATVLR